MADEQQPPQQHKEIQYDFSHLHPKKKPLYKRLWFWPLSIFVLIVIIVAIFSEPDETEEPSDNQQVTAASADGTTEDLAAEKVGGEKPEPVQEPVLLTASEFEQMYSAPKKFKGRKVDFYGKVFVEPERDDKGVYLQMYADPKKSEKNTIVGFADPNFAIENGDFVHVTGIVNDEFKGQNMFGGEVVAPVIVADTLEKSDYITAVSPAIQTIEVGQEIDQHGYVMKLEKVEVAADETRLYLKITNKSKDKINFFDFNSNLVQGSTQYEPAPNFDADYKEIQSELLPNIESDGIIVFEKIDPAKGDLKFIAEGSSDNYELDFKPFEFTIKVQ